MALYIGRGLTWAKGMKPRRRRKNEDSKKGGVEKWRDTVREKERGGQREIRKE